MSRNMGGSITRADVAKAAGVAESTVSRVVSGHRNVSKTMRDRVMAVVGELGYQPDLVARSLRAGSTRQLGLIVSDVENAFFHGVTMGAGEEASRQGYTLILCLTKWGLRDPVNSLVGRKVDAVVTCLGRTGEDELGPLLSAGIPMCTCGYDLYEAPSVPWVAPDDLSGAISAAEYIVGLGHRRIALVPGEPESLRSKRLEGWLQVLGAGGLVPAMVGRPGSWDYSAGAAVAGRVADSGATAVLFGSDMMAMGFINASYDLGLKVPEDISVIGFDDVWMASTFRPALTTVRVSSADLGRAAVGLALEISRGSQVGSVIKPSELVVRGSTAPPNPRLA